MVWLGGGRFVGTDNAYIKAESATISAEVSGPVKAVNFKENQQVNAGDVLFSIDRAPYEIALARANAALLTIRTEVAGLKANYAQLIERLAMAQEDLKYRRREYDRQRVLADRKYASDAKLDAARHGVAQAEGAVKAITQEMAAIRARLSGDPEIAVEDHPAFLEAMTRHRAAMLDLARTDVKAPISGIAAKLPHAGEFVRAGSNIMQVISHENLWIEANMKETDLENVTVGQAVEVHIDVYPGHTWYGKVTSISPATGAEFSILPPQNATGNWVKVVQRVPVRIGLSPAGKAPPLRAGLSAEIEIDTGKTRTLKGVWKQITSSNTPTHGVPTVAR